MLYKEVMLIICSVGSIQSVLMGAYFTFVNAKNAKVNLLLGLLFFVLGIRVAKSTVYLFGEDINIIFMNLGFAAHAAAVPFLFLYIRYFNISYCYSKKVLLHLLPAFLIIFASPWITLGNFWYQGGYALLLYYSLIYLFLTVLTIWQRWGKYQVMEQRWVLVLTIGTGVFLLAYFTNFILSVTAYIIAPLIYALTIYILSYFVLSNFKWFIKPEKKYGYLNINEIDVRLYISQIERIFKDEHLYLKSGFSLQELSEKTTIPSYVLSHIFNEHLGLKFTEYINNHRIEEIKKRLDDPTYSHIKIAALAYDCGFNSISAFNTAFRKYTGSTPSSYRNSLN